MKMKKNCNKLQQRMKTRIRRKKESKTGGLVIPSNPNNSEEWQQEEE